MVRVLATTPAGEFEDALAVGAGGRAAVRFRIGSTGFRSPLTGPAHAVSPCGTWQLARPAVRPVRGPPDRSAEVEFRLAPPPGTAPGSYWTAVKATCRGRIAYGPAIAVRVPGG
ncbi:hypothetical protein ACFV2Q_32160 [Streptomyces sp. NPDC059650]|uniref:hypothetical protein n=1 Tax=Streptomyces sp. NPDC059650 TaxID=3346896 RepID=UPI00369CD16F